MKKEDLEYPLCEGYLKKKSVVLLWASTPHNGEEKVIPKISKYVSRFFYFKDESIVYCKSQIHKQKDAANVGEKELVALKSIEEVSVRDAKKFSFTIHLDQNKGTVILKAKDKLTMGKWMKCIEEAKTHILSGKNKRRPSISVDTTPIVIYPDISSFSIPSPSNEPPKSPSPLPVRSPRRSPRLLAKGSVPQFDLIDQRIVNSSESLTPISALIPSLKRLSRAMTEGKADDADSPEYSVERTPPKSRKNSAGSSPRFPAGDSPVMTKQRLPPGYIENLRKVGVTHDEVQTWGKSGLKWDDWDSD